MKLILALFLFFPGSIFSQSFKGQMRSAPVPSPAPHYLEEYTFDTTLNAAAWTTQKRGLQVSFATTNELFFRSEVPELEQSSVWEATGWRGDRLNAQILVWSVDTLQQVRFSFNDLKNASGQTISKSNLKCNMVRYVVSNYPYGAREVTCGEGPQEKFLMPDRFEAFDRFELPGKTIRPVWLSLDIPAGTKPGKYRSMIEVQSENSSATLTIHITIQDQLLPKPSSWKHRLDLWQNPWVVAWKNNIKPWSPEHKALLKKHLALYADAGGTYITTYAVHSPWSDNSYMIEGGMIDWIRRKDGSWKFDYRIFDEYVQLAMDAGINEAITIYTPVPWGFRFRYTEEESGEHVYVSWAPDSKEFKVFWNVFLTDLKRHLEQKRWFDKTFLGINENAMDQTLAAIQVVKAHSNKWKITYAGDWHRELDHLLDDYSFLFGKESDVETVKQRTNRGQSTTYYVCCNPAVPNNYVFSPPVEGRWQGWYTSAHGYDGFLRWAYDAWPADPARDARHLLWPAGDCFLVYPGGASCIRFEKLREGIVDYEKIRILKEKARHSQDKNVKDLMRELDVHLKSLLVEKNFESKKLSDDVTTGNKLIQQLSDKLAGK